MPETIDQSPAPGSGGLDDFGGGDGGMDGGDDLFLTPQGPMEPIDDSEPVDDPDAGGDGGDDWTAGLPDDLREKVGTKYRTPAELARAYAELESHTGRMSSEIGSLRDDIARIAAEREAPRDDDRGGRGQEPEVPTLSQVAGYASEVAAKIDQGEVDVGAGIAAVVEAMAAVSAKREEALERKIAAMLDERVEARTAPLEAEAYTTAVGREIAAIKREYGEDFFAEHAQEASQLLNRWETEQPGFVGNPRAVRAAFNETFARAEARRRREASGRVLDRTGGSGRPRGKSAAQIVVDEMDALGGPASFGGL